MIIRNWMRRDPVTVGEDTLVSEANRIINENHLRCLPVIDGRGRLRGLVTRKMCLRAAENAMRSQDAFELQYFTGRLKVKDIMVRKPKTVDADATMESCLLRGQEERVSQFPVIEGDQVVGLISATEIFGLAAHMMGVWESWCGITLEPTAVESGTLGTVARVVEGTGATLKSMITIGTGSEPRRVIIRLVSADIDMVAQAVEAAGYRILEVCSDVGTCRNLKRLQDVNGRNMS